MDNIVIRALEELAAAINPQQMHPMDKERIIKTFWTLTAHGHEYDPSEIEAWLISESPIAPALAANIADLSERILQGKTVQGAGRKRKGSAMYKRWTS